LEVIWASSSRFSDKGQFTANSEKVLHDAEIMSAIGLVLAKEGMEDADSDEYKKFCDALRDGAKEIVEGAKTKNYEQAAAGGAIIGKACVECHENYRS
jgi:cytochrome c556